MKRILSLLFLTASITGAAQKFSGKPRFSKDQQLEVTTNVHSTIESMMGENTSNLVFVDRYTVDKATPDSANLTRNVQQIKIEFSLMGQKQTLDSDKEEDLNGPFGDVLKQLLQGKYHLTVDGTGKITAVTTNDNKKAAVTNDGDMLGMMLPGMNAAAPQPGSASAFSILPGYPVGVGDTWTDSVRTEGNTHKSVYTVKDITDTEVIIDFAGDAATNMSQSAMGMSMDVRVNTKSAGTITVDKASGLVKQKTITSTGESNMNMGGTEISSTIKSTVTSHIKVL